MAVPTGVQRLLGKSFSENSQDQTKVLLKASLLLLSLGVFATSVLLFALGDLILASYDIDMVLVFLAVLLVASTSFRNLFRGTVIASLKTKALPIVRIVSGIVKLGLAIILVSIGMEEIGLMIGFTSFFILSSILLAINVFIIFRSLERKSGLKLKEAVKKIFSASVVSWIPELIRKPGTHLGTIIIFGTIGASQAGVYFISFSVANAIIVLVTVLLAYGFPLLSGMSDGRKKLVWRLIKMSLVFGIPITSIVMFYANDILYIFGKEYAEASFALEILLVSVLPIIVGRGVITLVYSYGNYRQVLALGLARDIPRISLYFILVPIYGISGAALSFTVGSLIGFIVALIIAKNIGLKIYSKDLSIIFVIPMILGFILSYYEVNFVLSITTILLVSYLSYLKLGIITREDLNDSVMVLPRKISTPTFKILDKLAKKFNPSY